MRPWAPKTVHIVRGDNGIAQYSFCLLSSSPNLPFLILRARLACIATTHLTNGLSTNGLPNSATRLAGSSQESSARTSSARCGCRTVSTCRNTRRCCGWRFPTGCCRPASCACWRTSDASTTRATVISRHARTSSTTGRSWKRCRRYWPISPRWKCMRSRPPATACETSPAITSPARPPTRSSIRGPTTN